MNRAVCALVVFTLLANFANAQEESNKDLASRLNSIGSKITDKIGKKNSGITRSMLGNSVLDTPTVKELQEARERKAAALAKAERDRQVKAVVAMFDKDENGILSADEKVEFDKVYAKRKAAKAAVAKAKKAELARLDDRSLSPQAKRRRALARRKAAAKRRKAKASKKRTGANAHRLTESTNKKSRPARSAPRTKRK